MKRLFVIGALLVSTSAAAQQTTNITATDSSTGVRVQLADSIARTIRVTIKDASGNPFATAGNPLRIDPTGTTSQPVSQATGTNLHMVCDSGCSGSTAPADRTAFTYGTTSFSPVGGFYNSSITALTSGQMGGFALTTNRKLHVALFDSTDTAITQTSGSLNVNVTNGSNTVTDAATQSTGATSVASTESYQFGYSNSAGAYTRLYADPCAANAKVYLPFTQATSTQIITGTASKKIYLCSFSIVAAAAENVSVVSGTGTVCATNTVADIGATTAANGYNFAANGGIALGNGASSIAATTVNADNMCILQAGSVRLAGVITYVVQ